MNQQTIIKLTKTGTSVLEIFAIVQRFFHKLGYTNTGYAGGEKFAVYFRKQIFNQTDKDLDVTVSRGSLIEVSVNKESVDIHFRDQTTNKYPFLRFIQKNRKRLEGLGLTVELPPLEDL